MKYFYKVYGLNIESEVLLQELTVLDLDERSNIDVSISIKEINSEIKKSIKNGKICEYKYDDMWFYIKDSAIYHICNGKNVYIELCERADYQIIKTYILGSVLGMILLQRNRVAIHGGGMVINNQGCIFTGRKGAGKSTLTTALGKKKYKFISDDVCAIEDGNLYKISRGFPYHKLREDTIIKLKYDISKSIPFTSDDGIKKYIIPAFNEFIDYDVPFKYMFEICVEDVDEVQIEEIIGAEKLNRFIENVFKIEMLFYAGDMKPTYFKKCVDIVKTIKYYKITRPEDIFSVDDQMRLVEEVII